jgi:hypothetical protein
MNKIYGSAELRGVFKCHLATAPPQVAGMEMDVADHIPPWRSGRAGRSAGRVETLCRRWRLEEDWTSEDGGNENVAGKPPGPAAVVRPVWSARRRQEGVHVSATVQRAHLEVRCRA